MLLVAGGALYALTSVGNPLEQSLPTLAVLPTITPPPRLTETTSATLIPRPLEPRLAEVYRQLPGIVLVWHISFVSQGDQQALYVQAVVAPGYNRIGTVDVIRWASYDVIPSTTINAYITLDDGTTASEYVWLNSRNEWTVTALMSMTHIPTPVPTPYISTMPTRTWDCSADIYDCKALTCQEVWSYVMACPGDASGLDENRNGRPCEHLCD
jgi:hypothetical protein